MFVNLQLDIKYDKFIRTTSSRHEAVVKEFYSRVLNNGDIYRADYEGLYCINCEEYKVNLHIICLHIGLFTGGNCENNQLVLMRYFMN